MHGLLHTPFFSILFCFSATAVFVKRRVAGVEILAVELIGDESQALAKSLEVDDFSCTKEFDNIAYVGVIRKAEDIVVGLSRLLLCGKVFVKVGKRIAR